MIRISYHILKSIKRFIPLWFYCGKFCQSLLLSRAEYMKKMEFNQGFSKQQLKSIQINQNFITQLRGSTKNSSLLKFMVFTINWSYQNNKNLSQNFQQKKYLHSEKLTKQQLIARIQKVFPQTFMYYAFNEICFIAKKGFKQFKNIDLTKTNLCFQKSENIQHYIQIISFIINQQIRFKKNKNFYLPKLDLGCILFNSNTQQFELSQQYLLRWCFGLIQDEELSLKNIIKNQYDKANFYEDQGQLIAVYNLLLAIYIFFKKEKFDIRKFIKKKEYLFQLSKLKDLLKNLNNYTQRQIQTMFLLECYRNYLILWQFLKEIFPPQKNKFNVMRQKIEKKVNRKKFLQLNWLKQKFIQQLKNIFQILSNKDNSLIHYLKKVQEQKHEIQLNQSLISKEQNINQSQNTHNISQLQWYKVRLLLCLICCLEFLNQKSSKQDKKVYQAMIQVNSRQSQSLTAEEVSFIKEQNQLIEITKDKIKQNKIFSQQDEQIICLTLIEFTKNKLLNVKYFKQCANDLKKIDKKQDTKQQKLQQYKQSTLIFLKFILRSLFIAALKLKFIIQWIIRKIPQGKHKIQLKQLVKQIPIFHIKHSQIKQIQRKGTMTDVLQLLDLFIQVQNQNKSQQKSYQYSKLKNILNILKSQLVEKNKEEQKIPSYKKVIQQITKNQSYSMINIQYMKGLIEIIKQLQTTLSTRIGPYKIQNYLIFTDQLKTEKMVLQNKESFCFFDKDGFQKQEDNLKQLVDKLQKKYEQQQEEGHRKIFQETIFWDFQKKPKTQI